ncbi:MAG: hydrogenase maturation protease [Anaerolineae bacterium]|nr:hydrogenase maturation protease [Anaerolineae bacterium]
MTALILAYGNTDRQDDGVAWHVLRDLAVRLGGAFPDTPHEQNELTLPSVELRYMLQLTPEVADDFNRFDKVVFIDAHTGAQPEEVHFEPLNVEFQNSPLTHHLTPQSCMAIAKALHGSAPRAVLVSVRGYAFGFLQDLSEPTRRLVPLAAQSIMEWLA